MKILIIFASYLLGSIPTGFLIGKYLKNIDLRTIGSGSTGATNVLRNVGKWPALFVFFIDVGKGLIAVKIAQHYTEQGLIEVIAGISAITGHIWPIWLRGKGGKAVATGLGMFLALSCKVGLASLVIFLIVLTKTKFVSLSSISAAILLPFFMFVYLVNFIHFINIYFLKIISKRHDYFHKLNIHIRKIRQNILYINSLIPSYDYEHKTESSEEYIKLDQAITNRGELLIAVKKEDIFKKKRKDIWLKGRILFFSKEHLYVRLEEYTIDDSRKTIYIEDDEELIYLDKSWIPRVHNQIKKYCPYPSNNACAKLNWSDFGQKWKIPLSNLNPAKIATPWYSGPDVFNQDLANFIEGDDARGWNQIVKLSKINIAEKINIEAEKRFTLKFTADVSSGNISSDYKLRNNKEYKYKNSVGCSPLKYYIPKVKLNDALIWDNKNTIHRSPFMKTDKTVIRSFFNIRFLKQHEYRPHPYISLDMDMSQLM